MAPLDQRPEPIRALVVDDESWARRNRADRMREPTLAPVASNAK